MVAVVVVDVVVTVVDVVAVVYVDVVVAVGVVPIDYSTLCFFAGDFRLPSVAGDDSALLGGRGLGGGRHEKAN